jgi:hypothetical protein
MEFSKIIRIVNEAFEITSFESNISIDVVHKELKEQFWYLDYENEDDNVEIWKHRDDPKIGEYLIKKSDDGKILGIQYRNYISPKLNTTIKTLKFFLFHVEEITGGDQDPEGLEKGANFLRDIANELKRKRDNPDEYDEDL